MVNFGEKAKIKRREIRIKVVIMFLQLYRFIKLHESKNNKNTVFEIKAALLFSSIMFQNFLMTFC